MKENKINHKQRTTLYTTAIDMDYLLAKVQFKEHEAEVFENTLYQCYRMLSGLEKNLFIQHCKFFDERNFNKWYNKIRYKEYKEK